MGSVIKQLGPVFVYELADFSLIVGSQYVGSVLLGSLSNSVFERRTSTGSGCFASLGGGLVETLR